MLQTNFLIQTKKQPSGDKDPAAAKKGLSSGMATAVDATKNLNLRNWAHTTRWVQLDNSTLKKFVINHPLAITDFECIRIQTLKLKILQNPKASKLIILEALGVKVNLYSMVAENKKQHVKLLSAAVTNNRFVRWRAEGSQKYAPVLL